MSETARKARSAFVQESIVADVKFIARYLRNRAPARLLLACCAAAIDHPEYDIRKPYTTALQPGAFSGRYYDESYIQALVEKYDLPCNTTTAFLTPAFRNFNATLDEQASLSGRPPELYSKAIRILGACAKGEFGPQDLF